MVERDATSLGAVAPVLPSDLIDQVPEGTPAQEMSYQEAVREALREEMMRDERVFLLGEDIGKHGGAFGVTRTLWDQFGSERVRNTPISENTIVGTATGAALVGMRPVAELMFIDFSGLALDQIANQAVERGRRKGEEELARVLDEAKRRSEWEAAGIIAKAKQRAESIINETVNNAIGSTRKQV